MVKRAKIGLIYSYNANWIAGSYYILNLIHALNLLEDNLKPSLIILSGSRKEFEMVQKTGYPYLTYHQLYRKEKAVLRKTIDRILNKIILTLTGKVNYFAEKEEKYLTANIDLLFPASNQTYFSTVKNKLFWIPDFQEHFFSHFFSEEELIQRKKYQNDLVDQKSSIIFSSQNALDHFHKIYPDSLTQQFVLPFSVTHPSCEQFKIDEILAKYAIEPSYFFCANQFWAHKNHKIILSALKLLKEQGKLNFMMVFSGKETDYRNPFFFEEIKEFVHVNKLQDNCRFLGFIDREEQIVLMKHAISVVQPSLFEGWSTVVEDTKAINQFIILSNLEVHIEQIHENVRFFDPGNAIELANIMSEYSKQRPVVKKVNYNNNRARFGKKFIEIANQIIEESKKKNN